MTQLERLKARLFDTDNHACFIERDRILAQVQQSDPDTAAPDFYARTLALILSRVSTPVDSDDYFVGRVPEALPDEGLAAPNWLLFSDGHKSPDYELVLQYGLSGILAQIEDTARRLGDPKSLAFAQNAAIVTESVGAYARRYAAEARACGKEQAATALERVPMEPAWDLYSALQGIWLLHMIASCYVGSRDYAFGRLDEYLYPYYEKTVAAGVPREAIVEMLAGFFVKCNEICGRATHNYRCKPVLCQSSKQYVMLGVHPNPLSLAILDAASLLNTAQPQFTVFLNPGADDAFTSRVFEVMAQVVDKLHVYNYPLIRDGLIARGVPAPLAEAFTYSACCTFDLNYHTVRREHFTPTVRLFSQVLRAGDYPDLSALLDAYAAALKEDLQATLDRDAQPWSLPDCRRTYVLDSLLSRDCVARCRYPHQEGAPVDVVNLFCPGVATVGDSLMVLDRLVFTEKRYTLPEFVSILDRDFEGEEALHQEIRTMVKFGNDTPADDYTARAGALFCDVVDSLRTVPGVYPIPGFYSLEQENSTCAGIPATPDGRRANAPFSENQSPTYGADTGGITALLRSVARLPFDRAMGGGLNVTFSQNQPPAVLEALTTSYFELGGMHIGISVLDPAELTDAMVHPERHQALTVRLYGFSEYFVHLPLWQQQAILTRTRY